MAKPIVYIEARAKPSFQADLIELQESLKQVFASGSIEYFTLYEELLLSKFHFDLFPDHVESVKAVEFTGQLNSEHVFVKDSNIRINVYRMFDSSESLAANGTPLSGSAEQLPSIRYNGIWERLVFEQDIRADFMCMMKNLLVFSQKRSKYRANTMKRLVLLSGPPGSGKTSLALALAQKTSIRLNGWYENTKLVQINAATLMSRYYGESAQQILQIFTSAQKLCEANVHHFVFILIDEIESLAGSRDSASQRGELQETIKCTNALITGLDRVKSVPNLIIICTSNLVGTLDPAFLDRCGREFLIELPSLAARYEILRNSVNELIEDGIIVTDDKIPSYEEAKLQLSTFPECAGSILTSLAKQLTSQTTGSRGCAGSRSARYLGQLADVALTFRLHTEVCSLKDALQHMVAFTEEDSMRYKAAGEGEDQLLAKNDTVSMNAHCASNAEFTKDGEFQNQESIVTKTSYAARTPRVESSRETEIAGVTLNRRPAGDDTATLVNKTKTNAPTVCIVRGNGTQELCVSPKGPKIHEATKQDADNLKHKLHSVGPANENQNEVLHKKRKVIGDARNGFEHVETGGDCMLI